MEKAFYNYINKQKYCKPVTYLVFFDSIVYNNADSSLVPSCHKTKPGLLYNNIKAALRFARPIFSENI